MLAAPDYALDDVPLGRVEEALSCLLFGGDEQEILTQRARMSNLVAYCDDEESFSLVKQAVPSIVAVHPARVLIAYNRADPGTGGVRAGVNAWCQMGAHHVKICSEEITLQARGRGAEHLAYAIRSLLVGDLPTNLWWASKVPPPLAGQLLGDLAERAQQVIYDSIGWTNPARGVLATAAWLKNAERLGATDWRVVSDINWRRLKVWRRTLSQALDPNNTPGALESITEVYVEHGPHAMVQAWELIGWLACRLGWQVSGGRVDPGVEVAWQVRAPHGILVIRIRRLPDGPAAITRVRVVCALDGKPGALNVVPQGPNRLAVQPEGGGAARTITMPPLPLVELVARQLSDRAPDHAFARAMQVAQTFAASVA